jgi:hypothetical protein
VTERSWREREVIWAMNRAARVGDATGRHRWKLVPPFRHGSVTVRAGVPRYRFGVSTGKNSRTTHVTRVVFIAWREGLLVGSMAAWACGARAQAFELLDVAPAGRRLCPRCALFAGLYQVLPTGSGEV